MVTDLVIGNDMVLIPSQIFNNCESLWKLLYFSKYQNIMMKAMFAFAHHDNLLLGNLHVLNIYYRKVPLNTFMHYLIYFLQTF